MKPDQFKPQLAKDYNEAKLVFPLYVQPKIDGCFSGDSQIYTEQGYMPISEIVDNKLKVKVLSYNDVTKTTEFKPITNWFNNGCNPLKEWYRFGNSSVTANHKFYTNGDWKEIKHIKENNLPIFKTDSCGVFTGMLLGDSVAAIEKRNKTLSWRFSFSVGILDKEFGINKTQLTKNILNWSSKDVVSGYGSDTKRFTSSECRYIPYDLATFYDIDRTSEQYGKRVKDIDYTRLFSMFDDMSLAIWYFDDGSINYNNGNELTPRLFFSVPRYSPETHKVFIRLFKNKYNCEPTIKTYGRDVRMTFSTGDSLKLLVRISKVAGELMPRKIPTYIKTEMRLPCNLLVDSVVGSSIRKGVSKLGKHLVAYDIEVEDNHNYFVNDTLVSNCRMLNLNGKALGRSLKAHGNLYTTNKFSQECFAGLDGEMVLGDDPTALNLCSNTSGAISRIKGEPEMYWWCFDLLNEETKDLGYYLRYEKMVSKVQLITVISGYSSLKIVPMVKVDSLCELLDYEQAWLQEGYEGIIIRNGEAKYKHGRSSSTKADYWRVKRFTDAEAICTSLNEGDTNLNEAKVNELGQTERSSHKENLQSNGMVGSLNCTLIEDLKGSQGEVLVKAGTCITVSKGVMTEEERKHYWENQDELLGKVIKFKSFAFGNKDKPRFPTFLSVRVQSDIDNN